MLLAAASAGAAPMWLSRVDLSVVGQAGDVPEVAVEARGNAGAAWEGFNGANTVVQGAVRAAGGVWQAPVDLSVGGEDAIDPQVACDGQGNAVAVWRRSNGT